MHVIQAENITKIYSPRSVKAVKALDEISLSVAPGEIFGLLGPNGAGKTTFIKVILQIVFPNSGTGTVLGREIGNVEVKSRIGYLPENYVYPPYLTGEQVLSYYAKLSGIPETTRENRISEMLVLVEMEKWRKVKIRKYSKGMLQRIGLAQALINQPDLLILDEPTEGVDPVGRKQIREILFRIRSEGRTVFLNSHILSEVELICDRVAILKEGKLIRMGTVNEITTHPNYFTITIANALPPPLIMAWEATRAPVIQEKNTLSISVATIDELNGYVDQLRSNGVLIETIQRKRSSLEDMFIEIISSEAK